MTTETKQRRPHADVAIAFANGEEIQRKDGSGIWITWYYENFPCFNSDEEWRIKPKTIKYRRYIVKTADGMEFIHVCNKHAEIFTEQSLPLTMDFVKWIDDDWIEQEI